MIATRFRSVTLAVSVATAALGCYMVSLKVASERNALMHVERQIALAKTDIRGLRIELSTRGRLGQLERWNSDVLGLAAPKPAQYLQSEVQLAGLTRLEPGVAQARVIPVSAPVDAPTAPAAVVTASYSAPAQPRPAKAEPVATAERTERPVVIAASFDPPAHRAKAAKPAPLRLASLDAGDAAPLFRHATYEKPSGAAIAVEHTALLDAHLLDDISRAARAEQTGDRKGRHR